MKARQEPALGAAHQNDRVTTNATPRATQPAIARSWPHALGVVYAIPAAAVTLVDPPLGIPLALGVLPATLVGAFHLGVALGS
jgi:hypothetical protein